MRHVAVVLRSLGAVGLLIGFTFSCGNDTSNEPGDDDTNGSGGTVGGNGGTGGGSGGSGGSGGTSSGGSGGTTTSSGSPSTGAGGMNSVNTSVSTTGNEAGAGNVPETTPGLAEPCSSDDDCESDLICIAADSNSLLVGGPANGLCTSPCETIDDCALDAACITFGSGAEVGYCIALCAPANGIEDCAGRPDVVCDVLGASEPVACDAAGACPGGAVCVGDAPGECMLPVCLPKCGADSDCPEGRFCDPYYGECVDEEPEGKALNELCDPEAEESECRGTCLGEADTARCFETCSLGNVPGCGSDSEDNGTAACLNPILAETGDYGDLGACVGLCDCNSDCPDAGMLCISFESAEYAESEVLGRVGFCIVDPEDPMLLEGVEVLTCED